MNFQFLLDMSSYFIATLFDYGSGFLFPRLFFDVTALLSLFCFMKSIVIPAIQSYRLALLYDRLCGVEPRHWFYGHMLQYGFNEKAIFAAFKRIQQFPYLCNTWIGPVIPELVAHHPESVKAVLASNNFARIHRVNILPVGLVVDDIASAPKHDKAYYFVRGWIGDGLLTSSGKKWQRNRRLITPAFHYNILKPYLKIFNDSARIFLNNLKFEVGNPVEISERISLMTLDTMLRCAMSFETDCQNIKGKHPYITAVNDLRVCTTTRFEKPWLLLDWIFYLSPEGRRFREAAELVHEQAEKVIAKRREVLAGIQQNKNQGKNNLDFLDILLQTKDEDGKGLTDQEIRDEVDTFLFEGHDTTASAISWICYNLAKYPNLQEKCREEVTALLQGRNDVEWEDLRQLSYLTMFIKESMRVHPPVPVIGRYMDRPLTLPTSGTTSVTVPGQCNAVALIMAVHRHPDVWEDPEIFDPERFTLDNISKRSPHAFLPFSSGSRNCIGQNFAMNEIKTVVCQLVSTYRLYLDHETKPPIMKPQLVLGTEEGIFVKLENLN